jgi:hypothetical protein
MTSISRTVGTRKTSTARNDAASARQTKKAAGPAMQRGKALTADALDALCAQTRSRTSSLAEQLAKTARAHHADVSAQADEIAGRGDKPWNFSWNLTASAPGANASDAALAVHAYRNALENAGNCGESDYRFNVTNMRSKVERGRVRLEATATVRFHGGLSEQRVMERIQTARDTALDRKLTNAWAAAVPTFIEKTLRERAASTDVLSDKVLAPITIAKVDYQGGEKLKAVPGLKKLPSVALKEDPVDRFMARLQERLSETFTPRGFNVRLSRYAGDLNVYFDRAKHAD